MKRIVIILLALVVVMWGAWFYVSDLTSSKEPNPLKNVQNIQATATPAKAVKEPREIRIPAIGVTAFVESVGLEGNGRMKSPANYGDVAWYNLGYKPGEPGSAVMAGHLDDPNSNPAVFWDLKTLKKGDEIIVTDKDNTERRFKVTNSVKYEYNKVPLKEIFSTEGNETLALITCEGNYNQGARNYSHRYVVYAELE